MAKRILTEDDKVASAILKNAIEASGQKDYEIALKLKVSPGMVWQWANEHRRVAATRAESLAAAVGGVDPGDISVAYRNSIQRSDFKELRFSRSVERQHKLPVQAINVLPLDTAPEKRIESDDADIEHLLTLATPRSQEALRKIAQAAAENRLTDADTELLAQIADRFSRT